MSLFRVRDFWSADLGELHHQLQAKNHTGAGSHDLHEGDFIFSLGCFSSIGQQQDVFVCGNLSGLVCILQVPTSVQGRVSGRDEPRPGEKNQEDQAGQNSLEERQLLLASNVGMPVIDLKCGYFSSALKQSIAVLSLDKLVIYHVKKRQIDLLTASPGEFLTDNDLIDSQTINESLLTHELEEHHKIDLLAQEIAHSILILGSQADRTLTRASDHEAPQDPDTNERRSLVQRSKQVVQQMHLPQRDRLCVQYTNQFLFTLIDNKKVTGHFRLGGADEASDSKDIRLQQMAQFVGSIPMAFLYNVKNSSLVVSLSNNRIYCFPLDKVTNMAKQNIVRRVALNLIHDPSSRLSANGTQPQTGISQGNDKLEVTVDLIEASDWKFELPYRPNQLIGVQRRVRDLMSPSHKDELIVSQLLVVSRYNLDLFSSSGQHLWSQRFETPLICIHSYTVTRNDLPKEDSSTKIQLIDQLVSLICADSLSSDKSNLMILEDDQIAWSALLNSKPYQVARANLNSMSGFLINLDVKQNHLVASYLGTNQESDEVDDLTADCSLADDVHLAQLELLGGPLFAEDQQNQTSRTDSIDSRRDFARRLLVDVKLESKGQWPDVTVNCCINVRPDINLTGVQHNIVASLEFDNLLRFEPNKPNQFRTLASGLVECQLGNCWPDRREPIQLRGQFNLLASKSSGSRAMSELDSSPSHGELIDVNILPKTLTVRLYLRFDESHTESLVQEESFLLPLNIVSQLIHIDYSSGEGQDLDDILNNLNPYKRTSDIANSSTAPYFVIDLMLTGDYDILELLDDLLEGDLICRGYNSESIDAQMRSYPDQSKERKRATLENINLLAQSLDFRLSYSSPKLSVRQSSEEILSPVITSIALKLNHCSNFSSEILGLDEDTSEVIAWIHLCDLSAQESEIPNQLVALHSREWKCPKTDLIRDELSNGSEITSSSSILVAIECDRPLPVLFLQDHLIGRLAKRKTNLQLELRQVPHVALDREPDGVLHELQMSGANYVAFSGNLVDFGAKLKQHYAANLRAEMERLMEELKRETCKFQLATVTSLSWAKRLSDLPDEMNQPFKSLMMLTKRYHLNLMRCLNELERLKRRSFEFSKVPSDNRLLADWPRICMDLSLDV